MSNNLINSNKYLNFLKVLEKRISENEFEKILIEVQKIDLNHYSKKITIQELKKYILEYKELEINETEFKNLQMVLPGNPEIVFKLCLEAIRNDVNMLICIEDFCLAQNTLIIELINQVLEDCKLKNKVKLKNVLKDEEIIKNSEKAYKTICIGNSNLYNRLIDEISNLELNSYGIFEMFVDSEEFEDLKKGIYEYSIQNQFEIDMYDDLEFNEAIKAINRDGYKFCSILISKDKEKIDVFKKCIDSKYVIVNENPFNKIKFNLEIK